MPLRHLLFFWTLISLPGCFAAYIPSPVLTPVSKLTSESATSQSAIVAFSVEDSYENKPNNRWSRFIGEKSVGHQYLFPGLPITRLYFDREINDIFGEFILDHPKLGLGRRSVTNLTSLEMKQLFGASASAFKVNIENFSATAQDFFFLRKALVEGQIQFALDNTAPQLLEFSSSRFVSKASVEILSELIEESLFNALEKTSRMKTQDPIQSSPIQSNSYRTPTIICVSQKFKLGQELLLSKKNILIGVETYFRKNNLTFVSFRDNCPSRLPNKGFHLLIESNELQAERESVKISGTVSLRDLSNSDLHSNLIRTLPIDKLVKLDNSLSQPVYSTTSKLSEALVTEFFQQ